MTDKRDSKRKPKKTPRPKVKKETVKDLGVEKQGEAVKGGYYTGWSRCCKSAQ
jgi:hypothetical protein